MRRFGIFFVVLLTVIPAFVFAQTGPAAVRDYVGLINQSYHPGIVAHFEKARAEFQRRGESNLVKEIDLILSGGFGSGFLYRASNGNFFVVTNNHVISQAHTLSITFERSDGTRRTISNLQIIAADEETDLALLALPAGERPLVTQGMVLLTRGANEGEEVFSAGFPGLGFTPIWQFGSGIVSNASVTFPRSFDDPTRLGPFIQHSAPVDSGNSGGPLLVLQQGAPSGYAVAGVNTLKGLRRQSANFAVPANKVVSFIDSAMNPRSETFRAALDKRLSDFVGGLGVNRAVYPHIADFLSTTIVGENIEFAFDEMLNKAGRSVVRTFIDSGNENFIGAMAIPVAWVIEDSIRVGTGAIRASIGEVTGSGEEYTVVFNINNRDVSSVWVREYGNWRIKSFGTVAAGDRELMKRRQASRQVEKNVRLDSRFHIEAGYASMFDRSPVAMYGSLELREPTSDFGYGFGANVYVANSDLWSVSAFSGINVGLRAGNFGFMPYLRAGLGYVKDVEMQRWRHEAEVGSWEEKSLDYYDSGYFHLYGQAGLKVTTSYVPGLFMNFGFLYNVYSTHNFSFGKEFNDPFKMAFNASIGYAF